MEDEIEEMMIPRQTPHICEDFVVGFRGLGKECKNLHKPVKDDEFTMASKDSTRSANRNRRRSLSHKSEPIDTEIVDGGSGIQRKLLNTAKNCRKKNAKQVGKLRALEMDLSENKVIFENTHRCSLHDAYEDRFQALMNNRKKVRNAMDELEKRWNSFNNFLNQHLNHAETCNRLVEMCCEIQKIAEEIDKIQFQRILPSTKESDIRVWAESIGRD